MSFLAQQPAIMTVHLMKQAVGKRWRLHLTHCQDIEWVSDSHGRRCFWSRLCKSKVAHKVCPKVSLSSQYSSIIIRTWKLLTSKVWSKQSFSYVYHLNYMCKIIKSQMILLKQEYTMQIWSKNTTNSSNIRVVITMQTFLVLVAFSTWCADRNWNIVCWAKV